MKFSKGQKVVFYKEVWIIKYVYLHNYKDELIQYCLESIDKSKLLIARGCDLRLCSELF